MKLFCFLQSGFNEIVFAFKSPVHYAYNQQVLHNATYGYPVLPHTLPPSYQGEDLAQMIRKVQASFSWDWGPSYPSSGIWLPVYLQGFDSALIRDVLIFNTARNPLTGDVPDETVNTTWDLQAKVYFAAATSSSGSLTFRSVDTGNSVTVPVQPNDSEPIAVNLTIPVS
jgi:hypothetical protein